jgi:ABC-type nitrate/sulfonate/bicarbonate transport system substrate-binding protein
MAVIATSLAGCGTEKVTFMAGFKPQANLPFVAAYVAQEKGYFSEQGLEVEIRHSTGQHLQLLMSGDVDITTADASSVLKRRADPELPIVAFALFGQRGQQGFAVLDESGIQSPKDWEGKTFGYKTSVPPGYLAMLEAGDVDRSKIEEVRVGFDPRILTEGKVDILAVFKSNEPDTLRRLGFEVTVFDAADLAVPTLGLTYITRDELLETDPDTLERFLKATMKGLKFAFDDIEAALDIVLLYAENEDRDHMRNMLLTEKADAVSPLTDEKGLGWMTEAQWQAFHDSLLEYNALPNAVDVGSAFTLSLLDKVYDEGELQWP